MTGEGVKETEKWIADKGAKYPYAYDKGMKVMTAFGLNAYPSVVLIGADGVVLHAGSAGGATDKLIEKALVGALPKPLYEWPSSAGAAKSAFVKRKYADAIAAAGKVPEADGGPAIKTALEALVKSRVESVKAARQAGDYLTAIDGSRELVKQLAGLPEQAEVKVVSDELAKDEAAQTVARAQKKVRDMRGQRLGKSKEREKAMEDLQKIAKDHPGTKAAEEAQAFMAELRQRKS